MMKKLIHDYLDGELSEPEKDTLFMALANDAALRTEFDHQVRLNMIARSDMNSITPPAEVTSHIFASLGLRQPSELFTSSGIKSNSDSSDFRKRLPIIIAIFLASLMTAGVYYLIDSDYFPDLFRNINHGKSSVPTSISVETDDKARSNDIALSPNGLGSSELDQINQGSTNFNDANSLQALPRNRNSLLALTRRDYNSINENNGITNFGSTNEGTNDRLIVTNENESYSFNKFTDNQFSQFSENSHKKILAELNKTQIGNNDIFSLAFLNDESSVNGLFSIDIRKLPDNSSSNISQSTINQLNSKLPQSFLDAYSIALNYNLSRTHSLGIEIGNEYFEQVFTDKDGSTYNQKPKFLWLAAAYNVNLHEFSISEIAYPYGKVLVGWTPVGPLLRPQFGIIVQPVSNLSIIGGYEAGVLLYNVDGTIFNSSKHGFTYGIRYKF